jgi:DNA-binding winged helix-turn-helix (wHTH) protein/tetratricopeptide (TPR) repeat protein
MQGGNRSPRAVRFGNFLADLHTGELYKDSEKVTLQEQPFKILGLLLRRAGEVVTRDELREKLWPTDTFVDFNHGINVAIAKIRGALGESSEHPKFLETVGQRGYRFLVAAEPVSNRSAFRSVWSSKGGVSFASQSHSVGREKERAELAKAFETADGGRGLLVSVAGEPGIGKTTLVQDFLSQLESSGKKFSLAIGRCSQRLAGEEAYLPFVEALDSLVRQGGKALLQKLRTIAPSWYVQLFPLSEADPVDAQLREHVGTTTQEKTKRELAAFLFEISRRTPLLLFLDDVHWADPSTIDFLAYLATKFDQTRVLVIATYRPSELLLSNHPFLALKRDLQVHALAREIEVEFLSLQDVETYIGLEFPQNSFPREFPALIQSRTEGNPLFMVDFLRYLRDLKLIDKSDSESTWRLAASMPELSRDFPRSITSVIERKFEQLGARELEVLTAAAVQGYETNSAVLALALQADAAEIEEVLDHLDRLHALVKRINEDELPAGSLTVRYRFVHVLYQNSLYASLTPTRRAVLSSAIARGLEQLYCDRMPTVAPQLAFLYETARDADHSSLFFVMAAQNAARVFANQEAVSLARRGLKQLSKLHESPVRARRELDLQVTLAFALLWTQGYASPEAGVNMTRARELCETIGDAASLLPVIVGLWTYYLCKGDLTSAREIAERLSSISGGVSDSSLILGARATLAFTLQHQGELVASRRQFEETAKVHDPAQRNRYVELYKFDPGIQSESESVRTLWLLGFSDQARRKMEATLEIARGLDIPLSLAFALRSAAWLFQSLRQPELVKETAETCIALCDEHGIVLEKAWVSTSYGWAVAKLGNVEKGIGALQEALAMQLSIGAQVSRSQSLAVLAETLATAERIQEAISAVDEGLTVSAKNHEPYYDAELWRMRGELFKMEEKTTQAEECFQTAIGISRTQAARSLELRASMSLARLWQKQDKRQEAQELLSGIYAWFTEGFDTADLSEAASLLQDLS